MTGMGQNGSHEGHPRAPHLMKISPWLSVADTATALAFYVAAYGAEELERVEGEPGVVEVAHLAVDGADFWVQRDPAAGPDTVDGAPVRMILTVDDPDAVFARAVAAGARVVSPVAQGHGWWVGRLADPGGHHWEIGRPL